MINRAMWPAAALLAGLLPPAVLAGESAGVSAKYKALKCPTTTLGSTWAILQRDGANRPTEPYLSSLGHGEAGTGMVGSPTFRIAGDSIAFTVRGHDGQGGGENFVALVDARKGETLMKTPAPGDDALKERSWDVSKLKGREVRIEIRDGDAGGAFAWLGVEQIDASPALKVDFRRGIPHGWVRPERKASVRYETVAGGIPFKRNANAFTLIGKTGSTEIPCGFAAGRLFFLGCTVGGGRPLKTYGAIEIHYQDGSPEVFPLICGFTLDGQHKLPSRSMALFVHPSADPYQHYLVIAPRQAVIEKIRLVADPGPVPRITAVTCRTAAESDRLMALPETELPTLEAAWIHAHTISVRHPDLRQIMEVIRRDHKLPSAHTSR